ncbi:hypothetical protein PO909_023091 [Leuciscus waleckii]
MSLISLALVFLLLIPGVVCSVWGDDNDWGVSYSPSHICALKDSSVIMRCNYTYPGGHQIKKVFWTKTLVIAYKEPPDLSDDPEYRQRLQYLGDKQKNCTVRLSHVTLKDSHMYYFRFITDKPDGKYTGYPGVTLTVTDLQVESPERVTEGDPVNLRCKSSCAPTDRDTFIWYRNSQMILTNLSNTLLLNPVRREDSGRYSCAVDGDNLYSTVTGRDVHVSESADCDDAQYASVTSSKPRRDANAPECRETEEIQYATVQHHRNKQTKRAEENESHYDNIRIGQPDSVLR